MQTIASLLRVLAYNIKDFANFKSDGSLEITIDKVPMEVWKKFSDAMKTLGYHYQGAQDALELTKKRSKDGGITVVYSPGKGNEDHIKGFSAAVGKKDLHKPQSNKSIIQKAVKQFGITENPSTAGFILSDGRMLDFGGRSGQRDRDHREIGSILPKGERSGHEAIVEFGKLGNIRMHIGSVVSFDVYVRPTREQLDKIEDILFQYKKYAVVVDVSGHSQEFSENPEGVLEFIKDKTGY